MPYTFETTYDFKALTAMARALRKTVRRKKSRRVRIFGGIAVVVGLLLAVPWYEGYEFGLSTAATILAVAVILFVMLFEDQLNGYLAGKRMIKGTEKNRSAFDEVGFTTENAVGQTRWNYASIRKAVRTGDYFVFLFDKNHAQVYDIRTLAGGSPEDFAALIGEKTGGAVETV